MFNLDLGKPYARSGTTPLVGLHLLFFTLLLYGGCAGMVLMSQTGLMPGLREVSARTYAEAWLGIDKLMDRYMPPYKGSLILLNVALLVARLFTTREC